MSCERIAISTAFIKLDAMLKFAGAAETGGHAKLMIAEGLVYVDGGVCTARGKKLYPGMTVRHDGHVFEIVKRDDAPAP